jgi:hypothetical protein
MNPNGSSIDGAKPSAIVGSVDLWLDSYDDIFSDFDPSPYERRGISEDFLNELVGRCKKNPDSEMHFRISVPKEKRDKEIEEGINSRLKGHFSAVSYRADAKAKKSKKFGTLLAGGGAFVYFGSFALELRFPFIKEIREVLEFPCWFSMWEGLRRFIVERDPQVEKAAIYSRLAKADYVFLSEEDLLASITKRGGMSKRKARELAIGEATGKVRQEAPAEPKGEPILQQKRTPRNPGEKLAFSTLKRLSPKEKGSQMEELISAAKRQVQEGKFMLGALLASRTSDPNAIRNSLEGMDRESEEAETMRKIAIAGFLFGVPEFRHLSHALAANGVLTAKDMRRCAEPSASTLDPQSRENVLGDLPNLLELIKRSNIVGKESVIPRPPSLRSSAPPPPAGTPPLRVVPRGGGNQ